MKNIFKRLIHRGKPEHVLSVVQKISWVERDKKEEILFKFFRYPDGYVEVKIYEYGWCKVFEMGKLYVDRAWLEYEKHKNKLTLTQK